MPIGKVSGYGYLFCSDWREAFLISWSYGMGDPMAPSESEGNSEGGGVPAGSRAVRRSERASPVRNSLK
jgi:hypothetical protein